MRTLVSLWSLGLAACGFVGAPITPDDPITDARIVEDADVDGTAIAADASEARPLCVSTTHLDESFDSNDPCNPWGADYRNGNATLAQMDGELRPVPDNPNTSAGCIELSPHEWSAAIVQLEESIVGDGNYTSIQLDGLQRALGVVNRNLVFETLGPTTTIASRPYDPAAMAWLQLRRAPGGDVVAEYSADGERWTTLGTRATPAGPMRVNVIAGHVSGTNVSGRARFGRLVICD